MSAGDGGCAFPFQEKSADGMHWHSHSGMSLRDWFAGKTLETVSPTIHDTEAAYDRISSHCYRMADAMLKARAA